MITRFGVKAGSALLLGALLLPRTAVAASPGCSDIFVALGQGPANTAGAQNVLVATLKNATLPLGGATTNGGFGLNMWATIVDRDGIVCLVAFTGGLYRSSDGKLLGGIGVSGDSSCADHNIAWKTRAFLNLDDIPGGVAPGSGTDNRQYRLRHQQAG